MTSSTTAPPGRAPLALAAVSGLALFLLGLITPPDEPAIGRATAADVRSYVDGHDIPLRVAATTGMLAVVALLVFTAAVAALIRDTRSTSVAAGLVGCGGVVLAVLSILNVASLTLARLLPGLVDTSLEDLSDETVRTWNDLVGLTHFLGDLQMAVVAVVVLATATAVLRLRVLPRWLGWCGLVVGTAAAMGTLGITTEVSALYIPWFVGLFGWWIWWLLVAIGSVVRLRRLRPSRTDMPPVTASARVGDHSPSDG